MEDQVVEVEVNLPLEKIWTHTGTQLSAQAKQWCEYPADAPWKGGKNYRVWWPIRQCLEQGGSRFSWVFGPDHIFDESYDGWIEIDTTTYVVRTNQKRLMDTLLWSSTHPVALRYGRDPWRGEITVTEEPKKQEKGE